MEVIHEAGLVVGAELHALLVNQALPGTGIAPDEFFAGMAELVADFGPRNRALLARREAMQTAIDDWHTERAGQPHDAVKYRGFLEGLEYLLPEGPDFTIETTNVDPEIRSIPAPQLVVPATNARYALNAANARWGSLYDALYGTDAMGDLPDPGPYSFDRGDRVVAWARGFLNETVPLAVGSHAEATNYSVIDGAFAVQVGPASVALADPSQFVGFTGDAAAPTSVLLEQNGLGIEIVIDATHQVGATDKAHVADVMLESALTTIVDFEDSVAAVDSEEKAQAYHNWLGLMKGDLHETVSKGDVTFERKLNPDKIFTTADGSTLQRTGRSLLLARNVGHLMTTPAVRDGDGNEIPEGLLDALVSVLCAMHDLAKTGGDRNSRHGSVYVVKPKMHGPAEVAFTNDIFTKVEQILGLEPNTVKIGIMDEERRTTLNLKECIRAAQSRVAFINTGFLDRTGDEIHTSMHAGPMVRKGDMKAERWIGAYEDWNVDIGLGCGFIGRAQIGKGMWAAPDLMSDMLDQKIGHPRSGANCAWVPSPTAATLHATHYHRVDVLEVQTELVADLEANGRRGSVEDLLEIPVTADPSWTAEEIQAEIDNNVQGILGYVVRWVDAGVGCSKVPDINDVGLMEDRATCRISSQHIANWLLHGIVDEAQIRATFEKMAAIVDRQNADDPTYKPMAPSFDGEAYQGALDLVLKGIEQPSGYTEPILHASRLASKV
jgi:malate synthase